MSATYTQAHTYTRRQIAAQQIIRDRVNIDPDTGCWTWGLATNPQGYALVRAGDDRGKLAHRAAWEAWKSPVPAGLQIDHLCRVRSCCNPDHLEPVTAETNVRRAYGVDGPRCYNGHLWAEHGGTYLETATRRYRRYCTACDAESKARNRNRRSGMGIQLATRCGKPQTIQTEQVPA